MHKKPTGNIGPNIITKTSKGITITWNRVAFSNEKEKIENAIFEKFLHELKKTGLHNINARQNAENDFDFTLLLPTGEIQLDLAEVIVQNQKDSPYKNENMELSYEDMSKSVSEIVIKKSEKYQSKSHLPIQLLLYITHWRFRPSDELLVLFKYDLSESKHIFNCIYFFSPLGIDSGIFTMLFPSQKVRYNEAAISELRKKSQYMFNPSKWQIGK